MTDILSARLDRARLLVLLCTALLLFQNALFSLLLSENAPALSIFLIQSLPLLALLPGLVKGNPRSYQWLCFLILLYFLAAVLDIFTPGVEWAGMLEAIYCVLLFSSAIVFVNGSRKYGLNADRK